MGSRPFKSNSSSVVVMSQATFTVPTTQQPHARPERWIVDARLVYVNDIEYSLEELRASLAQYRYKEEPPAALLREEINEPRKNNIKLEDELDMTINGLPSTPVKSSSKLSRGISSPTINTKAALADIMEIFNQPLKHEQFSSEDEDEDEEADQFEQPNFMSASRKPAEKLQVFRDENVSIFRDENAPVGNGKMTIFRDENEPVKRQPLAPKQKSPGGPLLLPMAPPPVPDENEPLRRNRVPLGSKIIERKIDEVEEELFGGPPQFVQSELEGQG
ncbi:uncharacterized protein VTP21DRAFT_7319 [Calcarisporiella thermophila]|uniref:uncharacterized protein n=1 Tax=Calcarisporiella thermophila TaxID=911321 RepID=UPI003744A251